MHSAVHANSKTTILQSCRPLSGFKAMQHISQYSECVSKLLSRNDLRTHWCCYRPTVRQPHLEAANRKQSMAEPSTRPCKAHTNIIKQGSSRSMRAFMEASWLGGRAYPVERSQAPPNRQCPWHRPAYAHRQSQVPHPPSS